MLSKYTVAAILLGTACGTARFKLSGDTNHTVAGGTTSTVNGEVVTRIVISVDFEACKSFTKVIDQEDCMRKMLDLFVAMQDVIAKSGKLPTMEIPK